MIEGKCVNPDCTVATTGKCLLSHPEPSACPNYRVGESSGENPLPPSLEGLVPSIAVESSRETVEAGRRFHLGIELGSEDAIEIMRARYTHLIGVLGSTAAGKTCLLSSLYLLASARALPAPYEFAGSLSLQAFEDRARGLRKWTRGTLPDQLADRTVLADPRQPSLLHIALQKEGQGREGRTDLLVTDLPGEWTDNLVARAANAKSFEFLRRADGIILVVDGIVLTSGGRHVELQRMRNFVERLAETVGISRDIPFMILVSKADEINMTPPALAHELKDYVSSFGFPASVVIASAFSRTPDQVKSGTGVFEAFERILSYAGGRKVSEPPAKSGNSLRAFERFRG